MVEASGRDDFMSMVDNDEGVVDRAIFSDPEIYRMEMERIFTRCWNFVAHDSQVAEPGDFFQTVIGDDGVIVVRDKEGNPQVLFNSCRHRGNAVCRADEGRANSFMCTYHGWTYDLQGKLVGVPGFREVYHEELKREEWGLVRAPKVDSYGGLIFACLDPDAPSLDEYLGDIGRLSIDYFNAGGEQVIVGPVQKWTVPCNWKFAVDNVWDWYHFTITHGSTGMASLDPNRKLYVASLSPSKNPQPELVALGEYGHAIGGARYIGDGGPQPSGIEVPGRETLGPVGSKMAGFGGIFPNLWVTRQGLVLRVPKTPTTTEMWRLACAPKHLPLEERYRRINGTIGGQGPAGTTEVDDAENWQMSTRGTMGTYMRRFPLNMQMSLGHGKVVEDEGGPPYIPSDNWTEHGQRWHYRNWAVWMSAENWSALRQFHPPVPMGMI